MGSGGMTDAKQSALISWETKLLHQLTLSLICTNSICSVSSYEKLLNWEISYVSCVMSGSPGSFMQPE